MIVAQILKYLINHWVGYLSGTIVIIFTVIIGMYISKILDALLPQMNKIRFILDGSLKTAIWTVGFLIALTLFGLNVSAIITSLGLLGFGLGLALKDIVSNFVSGIMILIYQPFDIGDTLTVGDYQGKVQRVDLRYTCLIQVKDVSGGTGKKFAATDQILIPNSTMFSDIIIVHEIHKVHNDKKKVVKK